MGFDTMSLANATFQTSGPSPLTASPTTAGLFNFGPANGTLTSDLTVTPTGGSPVSIPNYQIASNPAGTIFTGASTANLNLVGVNLGTLCNPLSPSSCLIVKADFSLLATRRTGPVIPEPRAFLVFAAGLAVVAATRRVSRTRA